MHRSRTTLLLSGLVAALLAAPAFGAKEIFKLTDPRGDDHGDGQYHLSR